MKAGASQRIWRPGRRVERRKKQAKRVRVFVSGGGGIRRGLYTGVSDTPSARFEPCSLAEGRWVVPVPWAPAAGRAAGRAAARQLPCRRKLRAWRVVPLGRHWPRRKYPLTRLMTPPNSPRHCGQARPWAESRERTAWVEREESVQSPPKPSRRRQTPCHPLPGPLSPLPGGSSVIGRVSAFGRGPLGRGGSPPSRVGSQRKGLRGRGRGSAGPPFSTRNGPAGGADAGHEESGTKANSDAPKPGVRGEMRSALSDQSRHSP